MNVVWLFSYLADSAFTAVYFRRKTFAPLHQRRWLNPVLLLLFLPLYLNSTVLAIPYSFVRVALRMLLYFAWLYWSEGVPAQISAYAALFWTAVYTLFQNVFFGPYLNAIFMGQRLLLSSPVWSQVLLAAVNVAVRGLFFGLIALAFPFPGMAGAGISHISFTAGVCLTAIYTKTTGTELLTEFSNAPVQFSMYFILLHGAVLLFLLLFEYSRRRSVEYAAVALRDAAAQALLENIRSRNQGEESIRALRHDLNNHAVTLQLLLERQEIEEARDYLQRFQARISPPPRGFQTGNDLLDGLLCQKLLPAMEQGINVVTALDFRQGSFVSDFDLCTLMGNLLDNAIEAALQVEPPEARFLRVSGGPTANYLLIRVENSCPLRTWTHGVLPATTKGDRTLHGFGLRNVKWTVEQYGGRLTISGDEPERFLASVLLPVPDKRP